MCVCVCITCVTYNDFEMFLKHKQLICTRLHAIGSIWVPIGQF